jgi:HEAT repeat protein
MKTLVILLALAASAAAVVAQTPPRAPRAPRPAPITWTPTAPAPPVVPLAPIEWTETSAEGQHWFPGTVRWTPGSFAHQEPQDSLYREARNLLNKGEYRRSSELFHQFEQKNPRSRYAATAMYYRAFALYRAGTEADLRLAVQVLDDQRQRFAEAARDADVAALVTRVTGALAARGDTDAARRLREGAAQGTQQSCDREDMEVRAEALSALVQADPASAPDVLRRVLARRDECTTSLRRRAVYLLGKDGSDAAAATLLDVAKNDPSREVKSDAIARLAQIPRAETLPLLEQILNQATDDATQRAIVQALRRVEHPEVSGVLRRIIDKGEVAEEVRAEAVRALARASSVTYLGRVPSPARPGEVKIVQREPGPSLSEPDAAYLRALYGRTTSRTLRGAIIETISRAGGPANDQWLMEIVRNPSEELRYRSAALGRLRRSDVPIDELGKLYDTLTERELRGTMVQILGGREEPAATDKLIEIAKSGTDPSIRRMAIVALTRKNDPRTAKLLLDLVER